MSVRIDHSPSEVQIPAVDSDSFRIGHNRSEDQAITADPESPNGRALRQSDSKLDALDRSGYIELRVWSEMFWDKQEERKSQENRAGINHKGERRKRAFGGDVDPTVYLEAIRREYASERLLALAMRKCYRRVVPKEIQEWQRSTPGIGEHLLARLLGIIGDPRIAQPYHWEGTGKNREQIADEPFERNVAKLWAYCGHGDPTRRRQRGMDVDTAMSLGNPRAKTLVYLLAEGCMKLTGAAANGRAESSLDSPLPPTSSMATDGAIPRHAAPSTNGDAPAKCAPQSNSRARARSPYRDVYDQARAHYADALHKEPCVRCGPSGKPALAGSPLSDKHKLARALRKVGKEILKDLWRAAGGHQAHDAHASCAPGGHSLAETQSVSAPEGQSLLDIHGLHAPGGHASPNAQISSAPGGHPRHNIHTCPAPGGHPACDTQPTNAPGSHGRADTHFTIAPGGHGRADT